MKRIFPIILSLLLMIASGCGSGVQNTAGQTSQSSAGTTAENGEAASAGIVASFSTTGQVSGTADLSTTTVSAAASSVSSEELSGQPSPLPPDGGNRIVTTAESLIGIDFADGGSAPSEGFDNSGFIYYVLRENGYVSCPRQISGQLEWGETAGYSEIKPGDVVYFSGEPGGQAEFGGIYAGSGIMIYSPFPGEKVKTADITANYWTSRFVAALSL